MSDQMHQGTQRGPRPEGHDGRGYVRDYGYGGDGDGAPGGAWQHSGRGQGSGHRPFLPHRSAGDHKLGGVAGGLGRALGIDPVLIRVAFVVLAIFGGAGVLLYCLGWLLMPGDGDEVSAVEALAGRGRSSVSTGLTVVLIIVGLSSAGSVFSWGLPFWPVLIAAVVVFALIRHGRLGSGRPGATGADWGARAGEFAERAAAWGARAGEWGNRAGAWGHRGTGWVRGGGDGRPGGWSSSTGTASPFGRPAFWDAGPDTAGARPDPDPATTTADPTTTDTAATDPTDTATATATTEPPSPEDLLTRGRPAPPSWDPLGVAPFAWDLPDPTPEPTATVTPRPRGALARVFLGLALATGGLLAGGVFAHWWALSWAAVAGITLAVIGLGLLLSSLRGRGGRALIGPGIFLSLVTVALALTGITGTTGYGQQTWAPTTAAQVADSYTWNAGDATLDLTGLTVGEHQTVRTDLTVRGGQATILVPKGVTVEATCSVGVGQVDCLGTQGQGVRPEVQGRQPGTPNSGRLIIEVRSNAGQAGVTTRG